MIQQFECSKCFKVSDECRCKDKVDRLEKKSVGEEYDINKACPVCYLDVGNTALSRVDNKTKICRFCGSAEGKDQIAVEVTKEEMRRQGHTNYKCYLKDRRDKMNEE